MNSTNLTSEDAGDDWFATEPNDYVLSTSEKLFFSLPRVTATISVLSATIVLLEAWADIRAKKATPMKRIIFYLQFTFIVYGLANIVGSAASPADTPYVLGARGTPLTCDIQGFVVNFAHLAIAMWDVALSVAYVLFVVYNLTTQRLNRFERHCHWVIWSLSMVLAIIPWPLQLYNNYWEICFIASVPESCEGSKCIRGDARLVKIFSNLSYGFLLLAFLVSGTCMTMIFVNVRRQEDRNHRWSFQSSFQNAASQTQDRSRSKEVMVQGILYSGTLFLTNGPVAVIEIIVKHFGKIHSSAYLIATLCYTSHGTLYLLLFIRKRECMQTLPGKLAHRLLCCQWFPQILPKQQASAEGRTSKVGIEQAPEQGHNSASTTEFAQPP